MVIFLLLAGVEAEVLALFDMIDFCWLLKYL